MKNIERFVVMEGDRYCSHPQVECAHQLSDKVEVMEQLDFMLEGLAGRSWQFKKDDKGYVALFVCADELYLRRE